MASKSVFKGGAESPATPTAPSQNGKGPGKKGLKGKMMMKGKAGKMERKARDLLLPKEREADLQKERETDLQKERTRLEKELIRER